MIPALIEAVAGGAVLVVGLAVVILALIHLSRWMQQRYETNAVADATYMTTADHETDIDRWVDEQLAALAREREEREL